MPDQITTIDFFHYTKISQRWWAFKQMGLMPRMLNNIPGLEFARLLGSGGGNGFSIWPNFGVYAFLGVWKNKDHYLEYRDNKNSVIQLCKDRAEKQLHLKLANVSAHGQWAKQQPFVSKTKLVKTDPVAVITRATIYPHKVPGFWRHVPKVSQSIENKKGCQLSVGIGEWPLFMQATFSVWEQYQDMLNYAYHSKQHAEIIKKTRELGWYKEEMFARFKVLESEGDMGLFN